MHDAAATTSTFTAPRSLPLILTTPLQHTKRSHEQIVRGCGGAPVSRSEIQIHHDCGDTVMVVMHHSGLPTAVVALVGLVWCMGGGIN